VRRILIAERERKRRKADELDRVLADLLAGRFPYVLVEHKLVGLGPTMGPEAPLSDRDGSTPQRDATSRIALRRRATMRVFGT
jgi:hypothetical protein